LAIIRWKDGKVDGRSNAVHLSVQLPGKEDAAVFQELMQDFRDPLLSYTLLDKRDVIMRHPDSAYYRHVAPFVALQNQHDDDQAAKTLMMAVRGLPGAYVDAARSAIVARYLDQALGASGSNDQQLAGALSAKGRVSAQQLIDTPGTRYGPAIGRAWKERSYTTEQWQEFFFQGHCIDLDLDAAGPGAQK
jgi:hypothetical protein